MAKCGLLSITILLLVIVQSHIMTSVAQQDEYDSGNQRLGMQGIAAPPLYMDNDDDPTTTLMDNNLVLIAYSRKQLREGFRMLRGGRGGRGGGADGPSSSSPVPPPEPEKPQTFFGMILEVICGIFGLMFLALLFWARFMAQYQILFLSR